MWIEPEEEEGVAKQVGNGVTGCWTDELRREEVEREGEGGISIRCSK